MADETLSVPASRQAHTGPLRPFPVASLMREFLAVRACRVRHSRPVAQHLQAFANVVSDLHSATLKQGVVTRDQQLAENSLMRAYLALLTAAEMLEDCHGVAFPLLQWADEFDACRELEQREAFDPRA